MVFNLSILCFIGQIDKTSASIEQQTLMNQIKTSKSSYFQLFYY